MNERYMAKRAIFACLVGAGLVAGFGWVMNIVKICTSDVLFTGMNLVRAIGIFIAPIGAIMGFF